MPPCGLRRDFAEAGRAGPADSTQGLRTAIGGAVLGIRRPNLSVTTVLRTRSARLSPKSLALALVALLPVAACAPAPREAPPPLMPVMQWDHHPEAQEWTAATLAALQSDGAELLSEIPADIGTWCPAYVAAAPEQRAMFWAGLLSALARFESTWNPAAVGGGGQWFGLVQIAPATARAYGCEADSGAELQDGSANLECAVQIAAETVTRDGVVAANRGGFAADWGPFMSAEKRLAMAAWVSQQSYCQG